MKKINVPLCLAIAYIAFWIGLTASRVGEMPKNAGEPFPWWLPIAMGSLIVPPFILGWQASKESREEE